VIIVAMMALVVLSVPLFGGRLSRLAKVHLRHGWLVIAALSLQTVVISILPELPHSVASAIHLLSYAMAAVFLYINRGVSWLWVVGIGGGLNMAAIFANGGTMPAGEWATRTAGIVAETGQFENSQHLEHARLLFLGDIFPIPEAWPLSNVFSIGDVLLVIGAALVLHTAAGTWPRAAQAQLRHRDLTAV
jgi:hypothetical protein